MSRTSLPGVRSAAARAAAIALLALVVLVRAAGPAAAHGGEVADGSNYDSRIAGVVDPATGAPADGSGLRWRVLANDALLELRNASGSEVQVAGYEGEPYLRIGPDGVFENQASPASILNDDRYGLGTIPAEVSAAQEPRWQRIGSAPVWRWHDHRIHWMATTSPPQVKVDPEATVEVLAWEVPYLAEGRQLALTGTLWWVAPPAPWPWLTAAALALAAPLALAALPRRRGAARGNGQRDDADDRGRGAQARVLRAAAGLSAAVGLLTVVRAVDDVLAFPAPAGEDALVLARAGLLALPALAAVPWVRRAGTGAALAVAAGAAILALGSASPALALLSTSQVASAAPAAARQIAALVLALALPTAVALAIALLARRHPHRTRARAARPTAAVTSAAAAPPPGDTLVPRARR